MNARGEVVVVGAGAVGRGVAAELLRRSGERVVLVARSDRTASAISHGELRMRHTGANSAEEIALPALPALAARDSGAVSDAIRHASLIVVALRAGDEQAAAPALADGLARRRRPVTVLVCDNRPDGAARLRNAIAAHGSRAARHHGFTGALVDQIVNRVPSADGGLLLVGEPAGKVLVDAHALRFPLPAGLTRVTGSGGLLLVEDFAAHVERKLFVFSAGHAAAAHLGALRGHTLVHQALADPVVLPVVRAAMLEGQAAVAVSYGRQFAGDARHVDTLLRRFGDPELADPVARVGRDAARKLGPAERLCGPILLAGAHGVATPALVVVTAAALLAARAQTLAAQPVPLGIGPFPHSSEAHAVLLRLADAVARWLEDGTSTLEAHARLAVMMAPTAHFTRSHPSLRKRR